MKTSSLIVLLLAVGTLILPADQTTTAAANAGSPDQTGVPAPTAYRVVDRGANNKVWQREIYEKLANGQIVSHIHKYTELATGMHYWSNGQWVEAQEQINIQPDGTAAATQGQHQAYFPGDISQGAIQLVTQDGQHLVSRPVGIGYDDGTQTVLLSQLQSSTGQVVNNNQVVYPGCFTGLNADLLYTYKKGSFEQDVILHEQPPDPASFGLNPATTKLQVLTEFFNNPEPRVETHPVNRVNGMSDTVLYFGHNIMGRGRAFLFGDASSPPPSPKNDLMVYKSWVNLQGRTFLIEEVPLTQAGSELETLPKTSSIFKSAPDSMLCKASKTRWLPSAQPIEASTTRVQVAKTGFKPAPAFVLDYIALDTEVGDLDLQGDTTYLVSGEVDVDDTLTIEGGTVVKYDSYADTGGLSIIQCWGNVVCATAPYRPAIFTSGADNTVGENVGVAGPPDYYYEALYINDDATPLHDLRISYSLCGIHDHSLTLRDSQFNYCSDEGISDEWWGGGGYSCYLTNVLMSNVQFPFGGTGYSVFGCNLTIAGCEELGDDYEYGYSTVTLVNSLLAGVTNNGAVAVLTTNYTAWAADNSIFQTVGAASYYLATNSPYHNAGTTNLDPATLADLANKTTYPPIVYSNVTISVATTFSPQAHRDNVGNPDLGYHYDPLDYVFGKVLAATNLTFTAGTAVGWFELPALYGTSYGINLPDLATATFNGIATDPCSFARFETVQEGNGNWTFKGVLGGIVAGQGTGNPATPAVVAANFTHCYEINEDPNDFRDDSRYLTVRANHCEFYSGGMAGYGLLLSLTNCLFERSYWLGNTADGTNVCVSLRNCVMHGGGLYIQHTLGGTWPVWIQDCAFDGTDLSSYVDDPSGGNTNITYCDYNAFLTNAMRLPMLGAHDVTNIISFNWQSSWLGNYYQPTNSPLINKGSTTADQMGLYHFTTQTNQVKETNSIVDIGYHYVAVDAYGNPIDSNGDGIPDYLEDANGDGLFDIGDLGDWKISPFGLGGGNGLQVFTPLK